MGWRDGKIARTRRLAAGGAMVAVALALAPSCASKFDGPYACVAGYASCTTNDGCETHVAGDALNCGACGTTCALGGVCVDSACRAGATSFTQTSAGAFGGFAADATNVFWLSRGSGSVSTLPLAGGTPVDLVTGGVDSFGVDDQNVYLYGNPAFSGVGQFGIWAQPVTGATPTLLASLEGTNPSTIGAVVVGGGSVIWATGNNTGNTVSTDTIDRVPTTGGAVVTVSTFPENGGLPSLVGGSTSIFASVSMSNGACAIESIPIAGGNPTLLVEPSVCPSTLATDGKLVYWLGSASPPTSNDGNDNGQAPSTCLLELHAVPVGGGGDATLASFSSVEVPSSVVSDGTNVYFATYDSVWKVPAAGGAVTPIAGALGGPTFESMTSTAGNGGLSCGDVGALDTNASVTLALGPASVFIADGFNGAILEAPK